MTASARTHGVFGRAKVLWPKELRALSGNTRFHFRDRISFEPKSWPKQWSLRADIQNVQMSGVDVAIAGAQCQQTLAAAARKTPASASAYAETKNVT